MPEEKNGTEKANTFCFLGKFLKNFDTFSRNAPALREHLALARLELLKAAKILLDSKIDALEREKSPEKGKVARKISIE